MEEDWKEDSLTAHWDKQNVSPLIKKIATYYIIHTHKIVYIIYIYKWPWNFTWDRSALSSKKMPQNNKSETVHTEDIHER
jgi:hypothetical protein